MAIPTKFREKAPQKAGTCIRIPCQCENPHPNADEMPQDMMDWFQTVACDVDTAYQFDNEMISKDFDQF